MAEIQAALPAKFLQVASANKAAHKGGAPGNQEVGAFFGALKAQLAKSDGMEASLALGLKVESVKAPENLTEAGSAAGLEKPAKSEIGAESVSVIETDSESESQSGSEPGSDSEYVGESKSASTKQHLLDQAEAASESEQPVTPALVPSIPVPVQTSASEPTPTSVPASTSTPADPVLQAAAVSSLIVSVVPAPSSDISSKLDAESALTAGKQTGDAGEMSIAIARPDGSNKANGSAEVKTDSTSRAALNMTANAAETRQVLPAEMRSSQADLAAASIDAKLFEGAETFAAPVLSPLLGSRGEAGSAPSIVLPHPFEQSLRQAEAKVHASIEVPVRSAAFAAELGEKVVWLAGRQSQLADLSLNPPQMGALEVRLTVSGGDATAQFFSPNPLVRDAIDAALPKLRELMAQAGLNLGEANVRDQAFGRRENPDAQSKSTNPDADIATSQAVLSGVGARQSRGVGLVDLYI
ncbi:MAG: hypothetical protein B7Y41_10800 [Hydrogenophilales bacterium 28-61-23]|nr:MAG: hypothetical protein B7Y41_10800 [Hydrogenophilales bacterium 28-61-23]